MLLESDWMGESGWGLFPRVKVSRYSIKRWCLSFFIFEKSTFVAALAHSGIPIRTLFSPRMEFEAIILMLILLLLPFRASCTWKVFAAWRKVKQSSLLLRSHRRAWSRSELPVRVASSAWAVKGDPKAKRSRSDGQRKTGKQGWTAKWQGKSLEWCISGKVRWKSMQSISSHPSPLKTSAFLKPINSFETMHLSDNKNKCSYISWQARVFSKSEKIK